MNNKGKNLGQLIKKSRNEIGMTQQVLGDIVFGNFNYKGAQIISNCERGKASICPKHFVKILRALEIDRNELLKAYCLDYMDTILFEIMAQEKKQEAADKKAKIKKEAIKINHQENIASAKDAWKMLGLENL